MDNQKRSQRWGRLGEGEGEEDGQSGGGKLQLRFVKWEEKGREEGKEGGDRGEEGMRKAIDKGRRGWASSFCFSFFIYCKRFDEFFEEGKEKG